MVQVQKIRRELLRVWHQAFDAACLPIDRFRQRRHDAAFPRVVRLSDGAQPAGSRIALFLIYQPGAVAASVAVTCRALVEQGFAVLLVSNTPIRQAERDALSPWCWRIAERPNFGYDFGGYRDGLRLIREAGLDPERLLILNDSVWYPTSPDCRLLDRLEAEGRAVTGPVFVHNPGRSAANRHFQSFMLLLRREALQSSAFADYWRDCRVSNTKRVVLKHGEKGFWRAMRRGGLADDPLPTREVLHHALARQSNAFLRKTLEYAAYAEQTLLDEARVLLSADIDAPGWRERALAHMERALSRNSAIGVFVYAAMVLLDLGFLKKRSCYTVLDGMRWQYLRAVRNGDLPDPHPSIMAELLASKMDASMTTDPHARLRQSQDIQFQPVPVS